VSAEATIAARGCLRYGGMDSGQGTTRTAALLESIAWSLLSIAESLDAETARREGGL